MPYGDRAARAGPKDSGSVSFAIIKHRKITALDVA
jgi:hypothetical protein